MYDKQNAPHVIYDPFIPQYDFMVEGLSETEMNRLIKELPEKWIPFLKNKFESYPRYAELEIERNTYEWEKDGKYTLENMDTLMIYINGKYKQYRKKIVKDCKYKPDNMYLVIEILLWEFLRQEINKTEHWTMFHNHYLPEDV